MLWSKFTKDGKTLGSLRVELCIDSPAAPSAKHNIVWRYWHSRVKVTLYHPCWKAPVLLLRMFSSRWKVLHSLEPTSPYCLFGSGILSSRQDPLRWTCMGVPTCQKAFFIHLWYKRSWLIAANLLPSIRLIWSKHTWVHFDSFNLDTAKILKEGTSTSNGSTTSIPYTNKNRVAPVDVLTKVW